MALSYFKVRPFTVTCSCGWWWAVDHCNYCGVYLCGACVHSHTDCAEKAEADARRETNPTRPAA